jgi:hypothetical protein
MTGPDLIRFVIETGLSEAKERRTSALRAFTKYQYSLEQEVKFKQVELQNKLLDLFVDVPIELGRNFFRGDVVTHQGQRVFFEQEAGGEMVPSSARYINPIAYISPIEMHRRQLHFESLENMERVFVTHYARDNVRA